MYVGIHRGKKRIKVDHFKNLVEKVSKIDSSNIILIGDFNARTKDLNDIMDDYENDQSGHDIIS